MHQKHLRHRRRRRRRRRHLPYCYRHPLNRTVSTVVTRRTEHGCRAQLLCKCSRFCLSCANLCVRIRMLSLTVYLHFPVYIPALSVSLYLFLSLYIYLSICLAIYLSMLSCHIYLSICMSCLGIYYPIHLSIFTLFSPAYMCV